METLAGCVYWICILIMKMITEIRSVLCFACMLLMISACTKGKFDDYDEVRALGHGGMGISSIYPLNSYESILYCLALGAEGTEIDVQMTSDKVLMAYHPKDLSAKTNKSGLIHEQTYGEIKTATYNLPLHADYQLARLDILFDAIDVKEDQSFFLDCKNYNPDTSLQYLNDFTDALIELIDQFDLKEQLVVELKRRDLIEVLQSKRPDIKIFAFAPFEDAMSIATELDLPGLVISIENINDEQVEMAKAAGLEVAVFNTHTRQRNIDAIEMRVDYIQTDNLKQLLKLLGR